MQQRKNGVEYGGREQKLESGSQTEAKRLGDKPQTEEMADRVGGLPACT